VRAKASQASLTRSASAGAPRTTPAVVFTTGPLMSARLGGPAEPARPLNPNRGSRTGRR